MSYEPPADDARGVPPPAGSGDYGSGTPTRPTGGAPGLAQPAGGGLFDSYRRAVLSPSVEVFEEEIPRASWNKTLTGVGLVTLTTAVVSLIVFYLFSALLPDLYDPARQIRQAETELSRSGLLERFQGVLDALAFFLSGWGLLFSILLTPIFFFLGAIALFISSRLFGGRGANFMTHTYLLSLSYAPLRVVSTLAGLIPVVSGIVSLALFFYQLYLAGLSMQASQRMEPGKAMMAAFIPLIVLLVVACLGIVIIGVVFASMFRN